VTQPRRRPVLTGGCQCGAIRYALASQPTGASICHCRMCQKAFGNYFAPLAGVPRADLSWTRGEPGRFRSSEAVERGFCRDCGTPLYYTVLERDRISVSLGSLDDPSAVAPESQFGTEGMQPFFAHLHELPAEPTDVPDTAAAQAAYKSLQAPDHD
jgi:hypothetical protein